ncbi:MAG: energy transducer TonB [Desulfuromonadales bacterium]|nr:energy transducer TonB [Desulfuromonadales bacterium]NIS39240.1 energy transducer TonB [Desulfuromonadales bacterium]
MAVLLSVAVHAVLASVPHRAKLPERQERYAVEIGLVEAAEFVPDRTPVRNLAQPTPAQTRRHTSEPTPPPPAKKVVRSPAAENPPAPVLRDAPDPKRQVAELPPENKEAATPDKNADQEPKKNIDDAIAETPGTDQTSRHTVAEISATTTRTRARPVSTGNPSPHYPLLALRRGWEGEVVLRVRVNSSGSVERIRVHTSSGYALLDDSAVDAVRFWRFRPARNGREPVAAVVRVPVLFRLQKG